MGLDDLVDDGNRFYCNSMMVIGGLLTLGAVAGLSSVGVRVGFEEMELGIASHLAQEYSVFGVSGISFLIFGYLYK